MELQAITIVVIAAIGALVVLAIATVVLHRSRTRQPAGPGDDLTSAGAERSSDQSSLSSSSRDVSPAANEGPVANAEPHESPEQRWLPKVDPEADSAPSSQTQPDENRPHQREPVSVESLQEAVVAQGPDEPAAKSPTTAWPNPEPLAQSVGSPGRITHRSSLAWLAAAAVVGGALIRWIRHR